MSKMQLALERSEKHLGFIQFVVPSVLSMVFMSLYTIIDGVFVGQFSGPQALAGINIVLPIFSLAGGLGIMAASGGSAIVGIALGAGDREKASKVFSMVTTATTASGILISLIAFLNLEPLLLFLGATEKLMPYAKIYGLMIVLMIPVFIVKVLLEFFMRVDGNPHLSLILSISGGVINIVLDWYFMAVLHMGIAGAALATAIGACVSMAIGVWYFIAKAHLKFSFATWDLKTLGSVAFNGSSEMLTELSTGVTTFFFNITAIKLAGENGLAALSVLMYSHFLLMSVFLGFSSGVAPLVSFAEGAGEKALLSKIVKRSKHYILAASLIVVVIAYTQSQALAGIFLNAQSEVYTMTVSAIEIFSAAFFFMGLNIFASARFTALNKGLKSAVIALQRSLIGTLIGIALLPSIFGLNGLWLVIPFAELFAFVTVLALEKKPKLV